MKKPHLLAIAFALNSSLTMLAQDIVVVEMNDNTVQEFYVEDIERIIFRSAGVIPNDTTAYLTCPDYNHPHLIDLGLPSGTKWACCNVDAFIPEEDGGYFAWGETEEKEIYDDATYAYSTGIDENGDGFYDRDITYHSIGDDIAGTQYDVAHVKWGGTWRMPSIEQWYELFNDCRTKWTTQNGVDGRLVTGPSGGSIFLPASGGRAMWLLTFKGIYGKYWASSINPDYEGGASYVFFTSEFWDPTHYEYRTRGFSVRAVHQ